MFAFVATFIPRNPAKPEATAPIMNERAINALESALPEFAKPRMKATATTKTPSIRYSARRKAIAPSAMLAPIVFIR